MVHNTVLNTLRGFKIFSLHDFSENGVGVPTGAGRKCSTLVYMLCCIVSYVGFIVVK
jgi:hypothetical protein